MGLLVVMGQIPGRPGPDDELAAIFADHYPATVRLAAWLTGDRARAEDLAQDAFVRLARGDLSQVASVEAYLRTIVVNLCRSHHRRLSLGRRRRRQLEQEAETRATVAEPDALLADEELVRALDGLSRRQRECVVAAAVAMVAAAGAHQLRYPSPTAPPTEAELAAETTGPVIVNGPPSWWWVVGLAALAAVLGGLTPRLASDRGRLVSAGLGLVVAGLLATTLVLGPHVRAGTRLAEEAPTIEGYDLVTVELQYLTENTAPHRRATLTYRAQPDTPSPPLIPDHLTIGDRLDPELEALGFTHSFPNLGPRCHYRPQHPDARWEEGDHYCLLAVTGNELVVAATPAGFGAFPWFPDEVGLPLVLIGLVALALAAGPRPSGLGRPWTTDLAYAVALGLTVTGLVAVGRIMVDLVLVGPFGFVADCGWYSINHGACADQVRAVIARRGVQNSAARLYSPIIFLHALAGLGLTGLGWTIAGATGASLRRRRLLTVVSVLVQMAIVVPLVVFHQRLEILEIYND